MVFNGLNRLFTRQLILSERRAQKICEENRIPDVARFSRMWLIPKDTEKATNRRYKKNKMEF
ncbi:MAG: DNA-binding protein [Bacillota bacterium]|nr:DNA-binding protein [Bacillota bacterium]